MTAGVPALRYRPVHVRHVVRGQQTDPGAVQVLGSWLVPQDRRGVNGPAGMVSGEAEERLLEHGTGKLKFPNAIGGDGVRHLDRFRCLGSTAAAYAPGDEWLEVYEGPSPHGDLVAVVTPTAARIAGGSIELDAADGLWLLNLQRETAAGHWNHAPRDVIEHYTGAWQTVIGESFATRTPPGSAFVNASTEQTTPDGRWRTLRAEQGATGPVRLRIDQAGAFGSAYVRSTASVDIGTTTTMRAEAALRLDNGATGSSERPLVYLRLRKPDGGIFADIQVGSAITRVNTFAGERSVKAGPPTGSLVTLALEVRGRWIFGYVDGVLVAVLACPPPTAGVAVAAGATTAVIPGNPAAPAQELHFLLVRHLKPFLMRGADKGDLRLPGAPTPGGLAGEYFDDADVKGDLNRILSPERVPYARRLDARIDAPAQYNDWQVLGPANSNFFSVRWTGAIQLLASPATTRVRLTSLDDAGRLWIGRTRMGEQVCERWAVGGAATVESAALAQLGTSPGWYPIVLEYAQFDLQRGVILQIDDGQGAGWVTVPTERLSPLGIYQDQVRHESHHDALEKVAAAFGHQYRLEPRQLESGEFPGHLTPKVRVGRDTAHQITETDAIDLSVQLNAEEVVHTMLIDGAGTSDPAGGNTLTREAVDYDALGQHLLIAQAVENMADLQAPGLLEQRAASLLALRSSPWEEVAARDTNDTGLKDAWPLSGDLRALAVGDGARLDLPSVGVHDPTPRQILGRSRSFVPDGMSVPVAKFRQRPRSLRETVRRILKTAIAPQRNYQGALTTIQGAAGGQAAPDGYSRAIMPRGSSNIVRADLVVQYKSDASTMTIEVNGVNTGIAVTAGGRYDVTAYVGQFAAGQPQTYARLLGGTGVHQITLELTVRI